MDDTNAGPVYVEPATIIAQLDFLKGLDTVEVTRILTNAVTEVRLQPRQTLFQQDTPITHVWILLEGRMVQARRALDAQNRPRQYLERECAPGTIIGIYDYLFDTETYRTRARALDASTLLAIEISALSRLVFRFPEVRGRLAPLAKIARLSTFPLIGAVEDVGLGFLADLMSTVEFKADEIVYAEGATLSNIYLLDVGQVQLESSAGTINWIGNGSLFGLALTGGADMRPGARAMPHTCMATMPVNAFVIDHAVFHAITGFTPDRAGLASMILREQIIDRLPAFRDFTERQRRQLVGYCSYIYYPNNHLLIQQNEEADSLWVLMPSSTALIRALDSSGQNMITTVAVGMTFFGETALLGQVPQDSTVEADAGSEWLRLHWRDFDQFDVVDPDDLRAKLNIKTTKKLVMVGKAAREKYPWLQPGEAVVYFSRRHWIAFFRKNAATLILIGIFIIFAILGEILPGEQIWLVYLASILLFLAALALIWGIIDYLNDWLVVTTRRVVYQEKLLFVHVWRKEAPLEQIQNVDFRQTLLGRWFKFGTLIVQTAGTTGSIMFDYTTNFDELSRVIKREQEQRRRHSAAQSKMQIHRQLEKRLGLAIEPPSRVYVGAKPPAVVAPKGWRQSTTHRLRTATRRQVGNTTIWRKHWMALLPQIGWAWIIPFVMGLGMFAFWATADESVAEVWRSLSRIFQITAVILSVVFMARFIWVVIDWRNDTYELSDTNVVNVRKLPFGLRQDRRAAGLERIQNVEMRIPSPIHWLFNYGNVTIQTAAEFGRLEFYAVPDPRAVADEILGRIARFQKRREEEEAQRRAQDLPDWFEMYNRLEPGQPVPNAEQRANQTTNPVTSQLP